MQLTSKTRQLLLAAAALFLVLTIGLSSTLRVRQPPEVFNQALEKQIKPKTPFFSTDKLSELDFHLWSDEPSGTSSKNGVAPDGGPPQQVTTEESTENIGSEAIPVHDDEQDEKVESINEAEEEALDMGGVVGSSSKPTADMTSTTTTASHSTTGPEVPGKLHNGGQTEDDWDEYELGFKENVQGGEDISHLLTPEQHKASNENQLIEHNDLFSNMTKNGRLFLLDFINQGGFNPNIIPHPYKEDTWFMIAQRDKQYDDNSFWNTEVICEAHFRKEMFRCKSPPTILPIAATDSDLCLGDSDFFNEQIGPHDARVFYGPEKPFIIYGSQSAFNCLGMWIQDLRRITDFSRQPTTNRTDLFYRPTSLQRPPPYRAVEKNWFPFWDSNGTMYLHYDLHPRVFAELYDDGSVGENLAPIAADKDAACLEKLLPKLHQNNLEWNHQGTNSLSVTMCKRNDTDCVPTDDNTFIFSIIQTKTFYNHGNYEPYAFLFRQTAPFEVYAISQKPFWYTGRGHAGEHWTDSTWKPLDQSEMIFTTSISWKQAGLKYHGYLDDTLFIGFGIEDNHSGAIDVVAEDLMKDLAFC